jgi:hypothetical protein
MRATRILQVCDERKLAGVINPTMTPQPLAKCPLTQAYKAEVPEVNRLI